MSLPSVAGMGREGENERSEWEQTVANQYTYTADLMFPHETTLGFYTSVTSYALSPYTEVLQSRPKGSVLPHFMTDLGQLSFAFYLDFGSFRDIQRHRNGVCRMPMLTMHYDFEPWYLEQLDEELAQEAKTILAFYKGAISMATQDPKIRQYYIPLGFRVPCQVTYALPAALYVMELRSSKTVHPTLRKITHWMAGQFRRKFPNVALHADLDPDDWTIRRGQQTILDK